MTASLHGVSMWTRIARGQHRLFEDLNIEIGQGDRTALLGGPRSGKSTVLSLLCGSVEPDLGRVFRDGRISWPLPSGPRLSKTLTGVNNARFLARLYDMDEDEYLERIQSFTGIDSLLNDRLRFWPKDKRAMFTVALGLCTEFDIYLFDDKIASGSKEFRTRCNAVLASLGAGKSIFFATQDAAIAAAYCNQAYVLHEGRALFFPEIADAATFYASLGKTRAEITEEEPEEEVEEDSDPEATALF